jgi:hypothetical protein
MNLENIARAYVEAIELEDQMRAQSSDLLDTISELRSDLHAMLMDCLRENQISFADRAEAAEIAYRLIKKEVPTH